MTSPMGPPMLPGYSLRVQLFSPTAHALGDQPVRLFRVSTSPEVTIREFCEKATTTYEESYGERLAIKKVQDDQGFDVTQNEILGNLFTTMSCIRIVQAATNSTLRDSIPPSSALRYEPPRSRKRDRSSPNQYTPSTAQQKRQRIEHLDPDLPLPSREVVPAHANGFMLDVMVPNSQEGPAIGSKIRNVRVQQVEETPEPAAPRTSAVFENGFADGQSRENEDEADPFTDAIPSAHSMVLNERAKTASYHVQRATERGISVSTAATSPPSVNGQRHTQNGSGSATTVKMYEQVHRSGDIDDIYDMLVTDDEAVQIPKAQKLSLKPRSSPNGLPGIDWAKQKFLRTPSNGSRRSSSVRETPTRPAELALTPNSKERQDKQRKIREAQELKEAREAAAAAAEQRKCHMDEARLEAEQRAAEAKRARREEEAQRQVEEVKRKEAEKQAEAERLRQEKENREAKEAEQIRIAKVEVDNRRKELEAATKNTERKKVSEARRDAEHEINRLQPEKRNLHKSRRRESSSPVLPRSTPRAQSSTPMIPAGRSRQGILKTSNSVQSSSPGISSPDKQSVERGSENSTTPQPAPRQRTVSFDVTTKPAPIRPVTRILPPPRGTPSSMSKAKPPLQQPKRILTTSSTPQPIKNSSSLPITKPIPIPAPVKKESVERSISPATAKQIAASKTIPLSRSTILPPAKISSVRPSHSEIPTAKPVPSKPTEQLAPLEKPRSAASSSPVEISSDSESESDEEDSGEGASVDEDEIADIDMAGAPVTDQKDTLATNVESVPANHENDNGQNKGQNTKPALDQLSDEVNFETRPQFAKDLLDEDEIDVEVETESDDDERTHPSPGIEEVVIKAQEVTLPDMHEAAKNMKYEEEDPDATQSQLSSPRESRSPVIFSQNPKTVHDGDYQRLSSPEHEAEEEEEEEYLGREREDGSEELGCDREWSEEEREKRSAEDRKDPHSESTPRTRTDPALLEQSSTSDSESESDQESDGKVAALPRRHHVQVPESPPSIRPQFNRKTVGVARPLMSQESTRSRVNTQTEIDNQLTSSLMQSHSTTTTPIARVVRPPAIQFGASLSSLSSQQALFTGPAKKKAEEPPVNGFRKIQDMGSDSESYESSSTSDSDDDDGIIQTPREAPMAASGAKNKIDGRKRTGSSSVSDSDSASEGGKSSLNRTSNTVTPKRQIPTEEIQAKSRGLSQSTSKLYGKNKSHKYLNNYSFSQPTF